MRFSGLEIRTCELRRGTIALCPLQIPIFSTNQLPRNPNHLINNINWRISPLNSILIKSNLPLLVSAIGVCKYPTKSWLYQSKPRWKLRTFRVMFLTWMAKKVVALAVAPLLVLEGSEEKKWKKKKLKENVKNNLSIFSNFLVFQILVFYYLILVSFSYFIFLFRV